jgi:MYXO-CTERM domain-containing protein
VWVRNDGAGGLAVSWRAPDPEPGAGDAADGWIVQVSTNGQGFDDGTSVAGTSHTISGLAAGDVRFVRVLASNAGGRSLPSPVVGAAVAPSGDASVLVVGGFDRLDAGLLATEDLSGYALDVVQRMWLRRMNDGSYASRHGLAIADAGFSFDGATDDAIELGDVEIAGYAAIDWFAGEDSTGDLPLAPIVRDALTDYLDGGGRLLVSGSELGWALDLNGAPDEQAFFRERLHATYVSDDAETYDVTATAGPFEGLAALSFADGDAYDPRFPDVLAAGEGAALALAYGATADAGAAIAWGAGSDGERGIVLGFPFETIAGKETRRDVMAAALAFFDVVEEPGDGDDGGDDADSTAGDDDDGTAGDDANDASASATADGGTGDSTGTAAQGESDPGCGCTTTKSPHGFAWLVLACAALRRRRQPSA